LSGLMTFIQLCLPSQTITLTGSKLLLYYHTLFLVDNRWKICCSKGCWKRQSNTGWLSSFLPMS
jgi:hypothetical protein